jgi:hypothetical protein
VRLHFVPAVDLYGHPTVTLTFSLWEDGGSDSDGGSVMASEDGSVIVNDGGRVLSFSSDITVWTSGDFESPCGRRASELSLASVPSTFSRGSSVESSRIGEWGRRR